MNPELESRLNSLLDYLGKTAADADGLIREQAPLVAREIVAWWYWTGVSRIVLGLLLVGIAWIVAKKFLSGAWKMVTAKDGFETPGPFFVLVGFVAATTVPLSIGVSQAWQGAYTMVRATIAPRTIVIDYVKSLK